MVATGAAWAGSVTDNIVPILAGPGNTERCTNDPDGGDGSVNCLTDNEIVYYYMDSNGEYELESPDRSAVTGALRNEYSPTQLVIHYDSSPKFSGSGETDIIYQEGSTNLDSGTVGVTWCNDAAGTYSYECDQQYIRIRGNGAYDLSVACHESGHAVGLTHGRDAYPSLDNEDPRLGCMIATGYEENLGSNNVANINSVY